MSHRVALHGRVIAHGIPKAFLFIDAAFTDKNIIESTE
jgi:hypothetical protein